jgi:hypothetical protein
MNGRIRLRRWHQFRAVQLYAPSKGYLWAARARFGLITLSGYDRYLDGDAELRWSLGGHVPVMAGTGVDVVRAAAVRAAIDAVLVPTALVGPNVTWREGSSPNSAIAEWRSGELVLRPEITVANDGSLVSVATQRWSHPKGEEWSDVPYGGFVGDELVFDGIRIPTTMRVGNNFGTPKWLAGESSRVTITSVDFF